MCGHWEWVEAGSEFLLLSLTHPRAQAGETGRRMGVSVVLIVQTITKGS